MNYVLNSPLLVLTLSLVSLLLSELISASFRKRRNLQEGERDGFSLIAAATLTLLGLIIGFAFSMAISGTISGKSTKRQRPMLSLWSTTGQICCLPAMRRGCVRCSGTISINVFCSTKLTMAASFGRSMRLLLN